MKLTEAQITKQIRDVLNMEKTYIGIDPGISGAVGFIFPDGSATVVDCPATLGEIRGVLMGFDGSQAVAVVEKVNPFFKSSAKSAFTFGMNFAAWQMLLTCLKIPYDLVAPRVWQKLIYDSAKKLDNPKQQSFERASRLFPDLEFKTKRGKILDGRTDAMLITEFTRRTMGGLK